MLGDVPLNLADLRDPEDTDAIRTRLLDNLTDEGLPVEDWIPSAQGGVEMIRVDMSASTMQERLAKKVAQLAQLMLLELATGDLLTLLAAKRYLVDRDPATKTVQSVALWVTGTPSSKDFQVDDLIAGSDATGNHYRNITAGALTTLNTADNAVFLEFEAENAGSTYDDVEETVTRLVTARAGVSCANRRPSDFLPAKVTGSSTGTVSAVFSIFGDPPSYGSIRIRIEASGEIGTATYSYSLDGGSTWSFAGVVFSGAAEVFPGSYINFANGTAPSFIIGDIFTLLVGDAILVRGTDEESDEALRTRCRQRWMSLTDVPLEGVIDLWAHLASAEVERVMADADPNTPASILVTIATRGGPASASAVIAAQDYIAARLVGYKGIAAAPGFYSVEEKALVSSAIPREITAGGTVLVPRANVAAVQAAAETAWLAYQRTVPLGGQIDAVVRVQELVQAVMDAGATDIQNPTLNGGTDNITLAYGEVAVPAAGTTLLTTLVWQPV